MTYAKVDHALAKQYGLITAAVYGEVARYCGMKEGQCVAKRASLAEDLNISPASVDRSLETLLKDGLLTKSLRPGRSSAYVLTDGRVPPTEEGQPAEVPQTEEPLPEELPPTDEGVPPTDEPHSLNSRLKSRKRPAAKAAARTYHPAIAVFRSVVRGRGDKPRNPPKAFEGEIIKAVGEDAKDLDRWRKAIIAWIGTGYRWQNCRGMLDWFKDGIPQAYGRKGYKQRGTTEPVGLAAIDAVQAKLEGR